MYTGELAPKLFGLYEHTVGAAGSGRGYLIRSLQRIARLQGCTRVFAERSGGNFACLRRLPSIRLDARCSSGDGALHRLASECDASIRSSLERLYDERAESADAELSIGMQSVRCHRFLIAARCQLDGRRRRLELATTPAIEADGGHLIADEFVKILYALPKRRIGEELLGRPKRLRSLYRALAELCERNRVQCDWLQQSTSTSTARVFIGAELQGAWRLGAADAVLCCSGDNDDDVVELQCHRAMLRARCEYFRTMLHTGRWWCDNDDEENDELARFQVPCRRPVGELFLHYLYTGALATHGDTEALCQLYSLADFVLESELKRLVESRLVECIAVGSVLALLDFAEQCGAPLLRRYCLYFMARSARFLLDSEQQCTWWPMSLEAVRDEQLERVGRVYRDADCELAASGESGLLAPVVASPMSSYRVLPRRRWAPLAKGAEDELDLDELLAEVSVFFFSQFCGS